jgi:hypothetical protein
MSNEMQDIELKPFYVYELIDPFNNEVFYVGKGTNNRLLEHNSLEISEKGKRIKSIEDKGGKHIQLIIGRYDTEIEAIAVEATLIKWVHSIHKLTNKINGHHHFFIRDFSEKNNASYTRIEGLDLPRKIPGLRDGSHTKDLLIKIQKNSIYEKLLNIKNDLKSAFQFSHLTISDPDFSDPSNPILTITGFSDSIKLQVKMHLTGKSIILTLTPISKEKNVLEKYINILTSLTPPILPKNIGTNKMYAHVVLDRLKKSRNNDRIELFDSENLKTRITNLLDELKIN